MTKAIYIFISGWTCFYLLLVGSNWPCCCVWMSKWIKVVGCWSIDWQLTQVHRQGTHVSTQLWNGRVSMLWVSVVEHHEANCGSGDARDVGIPWHIQIHLFNNVKWNWSLLSRGWAEQNAWLKYLDLGCQIYVSLGLCKKLGECFRWK